jgi:hypothetical protein
MNIIINKVTEDLIQTFYKKGGRINKYYLSSPIMKGPALVYLNGWYRGDNLRVAILRALGQK